MQFLEYYCRKAPESTFTALDDEAFLITVCLKYYESWKRSWKVEKKETIERKYNGGKEEEQCQF
jgi:hypothetical protein